MIAVAQEKNVVFESKTASYQITLDNQEISSNTKAKVSFTLAITPEIRQDILAKRFDLVQTWLKTQAQNKIAQTQNQLVELQKEVSPLVIPFALKLFLYRQRPKTLEAHFDFRIAP